MHDMPSAAITRIEWDRGILTVWFRGTGRYLFFGVPEDLFTRFVDTPARAHFFDHHIRNKF
jgi:hypothetical protein